MIPLLTVMLFIFPNAYSLYLSKYLSLRHEKCSDWCQDGLSSNAPDLRFINMYMM